VADATAGLPGRFDVVTTFDVVHDAVDPEGLLRAIHDALVPGGVPRLPRHQLFRARRGQRRADRDPALRVQRPVLHDDVARARRRRARHARAARRRYYGSWPACRVRRGPAGADGQPVQQPLRVATVVVTADALRFPRRRHRDRDDPGTAGRREVGRRRSNGSPTPGSAGSASGPPRGRLGHADHRRPRLPDDEDLAGRESCTARPRSSATPLSTRRGGRRAGRPHARRRRPARAAGDGLLDMPTHRTGCLDLQSRIQSGLLSGSGW